MARLNRIPTFDVWGSLANCSHHDEAGKRATVTKWSLETRTAQRLPRPLIESPGLRALRRYQLVVHNEIGVEMLKRSTMATAVALLALFAAAAPAMALTTEEYVTSYPLGPGAYASGSAHTGVENSHKDSFGVTCPAVAAGYGAFTGSPNSGGNFTAGDMCGTGEKIWHPAGTASYTFHGAVWNQTLGTQAVYYGRYSW
jgi:hypothetical protein